MKNEDGTNTIGHPQYITVSRDVNKLFDGKFPVFLLYLGKYPEGLINCELMIVSPGIDCRKNGFIRKVEKNGSEIPQNWMGPKS